MDIYEEIAEKRKAGLVFALATIVKTVGSSPRAVGTKMLVYPDGRISGTIGGGRFEKLVIDDCLGLLASDSRHLLKKYPFSQTGEDATGMYCGGEAEVFMEVNAKPKRLIIFGGGHIGRELVRLASGLSFAITVVDDRQDILDGFSQPVTTLLTDQDYSADFPSIDKNCYIVIVTRSHKCDLSVLARAINEPCAYIGMIGSKTKVAKLFSSLQESGIDRSLLDKVHAPIGLDIGAEGPYEIAIAIVAEIIAARKKALQST